MLLLFVRLMQGIIFSPLFHTGRATKGWRVDIKDSHDSQAVEKTLPCG
jgi:hypothetical protein